MCPLPRVGKRGPTAKGMDVLCEKSRAEFSDTPVKQWRQLGILPARVRRSTRTIELKTTFTVGEFEALILRAKKEEIMALKAAQKATAKLVDARRRRGELERTLAELQNTASSSQYSGEALKLRR